MTWFMETNRLLRSAGKRLLPMDEHLQNVRSPIKRKIFDSTRRFPRFCGPASATAKVCELEDSFDADATGNSIAIDAVPLSIVAPEGVHFDFEHTEQNVTLRKHKEVKFEALENVSNGVLNDSEDDDCVIFEKKNDDFRANGTSLNVQSPFSRKSPLESKLDNVQSPFSRKSPLESPLERKLDNESDESEVYVLSPSEWESSRSVSMRQKGSDNDIVLQGENSHGESVEMDSDGTTFDFNEKVEKYEDLEDFSIVSHGGESDLSASRQQVLNARKLFEELCDKLLQELLAELKGGSCHVYNKAATLLKNQNKLVNTEPRMGHIPGVEIGDQFSYRAELIVVGLHHQFMNGINSMKINGKKCAISIVDSGRYENKTISTDSFVYSGHGGNEKLQKKKSDQKLHSGNLALKNSMDEKCPVRVIRKHIDGANGKQIYIYEGLYTVSNFWQDRLQNDQSAYMFEMVRLPDQQDIAHHCRNKIVENKKKLSKGYLVHPLDDLSNGKEKIPICVVNEVNDEKPPQFTYMTEMKYPNSRHIPSPSGCDCINGCSDNELCCCGVKNGGELPFNEEGCIVRVKRSLFRECGPSCNCPPSCQNRVSQHGIRYRLEVFKTKSTGWGVRSCDAIPSGGFICEYIGEFLQDNEAEKRINDDEYLFDLDKKAGFTIDALKYGNVGRFINHSCSPNLYAQKILYDCADERTPHIMFFATEDILPLQELSYDYNYAIGRVCDAFGNIKTKSCHCGSRKCTRRMY